MEISINLLTLLIFLFGGISVVLSKLHNDESSRGFSILTMALIFLSILLILIKDPLVVILMMCAYTTFVIIYGRTQYYDVKVTKKFLETDNVEYNFKAIFITDFQFDIKKNKFNHKAYDNVINKCQELEYDLVLLGGDYINYIENIDYIVDGINKLGNPKYGKFACIGNHDYVDCPAIVRIFKENNIHLLINGKKDITKDITIVGVDDFWKGTPKLPTLDNKKLNILLSHNPKYIDMLNEKSNVDLMLSGHYHAGQVNFIGVSFQRIVTRYVYGWYREKNIDMFVSSGIGGNVFRGLFGFHIRYFAKPEIVEIVFVGNKFNEEKK